MTYTHIVVGAGEVGSALYEVLNESGSPVKLRDIEDIDGAADILHVCIPWSETFIDDVHRYAKHHHTPLVVVHSTVPVGTCDEQGWTHSPIRGRHPDLVEGIFTFTKHVGGVNFQEIRDFFESIGIETFGHDRAATTEAGKLWELVQYGVQVAIQKDIYAWCQERGLNGLEVYEEFAQTYNEGYAELGFKDFVRPILAPMPGKIGGHCVTQNAVHLDSEWGKLVADR